MTNKETKKECCERCGLPREEWKGRWQKPLCKVGETTYDQHIPHPEPSDSWEERFNPLMIQDFDEETGRYFTNVKKLKDYINTLLLSERTTLMREIEKMGTPEQKTTEEKFGLIDYGFQMAKNHFINLITNKK